MLCGRGLAGETLAIHIETIRPEGHASGGWWDDPKVNSFLPIEAGRVRFPGGLSTPLRMMIGDIYLTPAEPLPPNPHDNGGNMDFPEVAAGHALRLRAQLDGGLLVLGDLYACQGDGEVLGLAAACEGEIQLRIERDHRFGSPRPLIIKERSFVCVACRHDYAEARELAARDASAVLARLRGCTEKEVYLFVTTVGSLRNGGMWAFEGRSPRE